MHNSIVIFSTVVKLENIYDIQVSLRRTQYISEELVCLIIIIIKLNYSTRIAKLLLTFDSIRIFGTQIEYERVKYT